MLAWRTIRQVQSTVLLRRDMTASQLTMTHDRAARGWHCMLAIYSLSPDELTIASQKILSPVYDVLLFVSNVHFLN